MKKFKDLTIDSVVYHPYTSYIEEKTISSIKAIGDELEIKFSSWGSIKANREESMAEGYYSDIEQAREVQKNKRMEEIERLKEKMFDAAKEYNTAVLKYAFTNKDDVRNGR